MPTGYTAEIANGMTFDQFALRCARAFAELGKMHGQPDDAPIPERFEPSDVHQKNLQAAHDELARVMALTPEQIEAEAHQTHEEAVQAYRDRLQSANELRAKYEAMLEVVNAWSEPSADHSQLKTFMKMQLVKAIQFDCFTATETVPAKKMPHVWHADRVEELRNKVAHHHAEHLKEVQSTERTNQWVRTLRSSLSSS